MRYENPLYMAEDAGAADLIAGGRLQLGISRGSPEQVIDGWRYFGYVPAEGQSDADMAGVTRRCCSRCCGAKDSRSPTRVRCFPTLRDCCVSSRTPKDCATGSGGAPPRTQPRSGRPKLGMNLQSSTLKFDESGQPVARPAGRADPSVPRGLEGGRPCARAARVGEPQHLRAG